MEKILSGKRVALVIAFNGFKDEEYFKTRQALEEAGADIIVASTFLGMAKGTDGGETEVNILLGELKPEEYDGVVFIGGAGAFAYLDDPIAHRIARQTVEANRVLGAICIAPAILAKAGVLQRKKATVWSSPMDKKPIKILQENGAIYQEAEVVVDGKIVTANGPQAAQEFGQKLVEVLAK